MIKEVNFPGSGIKACGHMSMFEAPEVLLMKQMLEILNTT
jgi:hypothetical protein